MWFLFNDILLKAVKLEYEKKHNICFYEKYVERFQDFQRLDLIKY